MATTTRTVLRSQLLSLLGSIGRPRRLLSLTAGGKFGIRTPDGIATAAVGFSRVHTSAKAQGSHEVGSATSDVFSTEITAADENKELARLWKLKDEPLPWKVEKWVPYWDRRKSEPVMEDRYGAPDELKYMTANFQTSVKKLRHVGNLISGKTLDDAIRQLEFCKRHCSEPVLAALKKARHLAMTERQMNPFHLYVERAFANKGPHTKEIRIHGRGKSGIMTHPTSHLRFILKVKPREFHYLMGEKPIWYKIPPNQQISRRVVGAPCLRDNKDLRYQRQFYNW